MMKAICLSAILLASTPALAEDLHYNLVEFSESASITVPRDTMNVVLRISESNKNREVASNAVTKRINAILAKIRTHSAIESETGNRSVYPEYDDKRNIKSWSDEANIHLKSQDFDTLSKLITEVQAQAMLDHISFSVSPKKHAQAVEQASEQALKAFKHRAEKISKTLGFSGNYKLVKIQINQSFENESRDFAPVAMMAPMKMTRSSAPSMNTEAGQQEIRQTVTGSIQM